jgi:hypothetical protein
MTKQLTVGVHPSFNYPSLASLVNNHDNRETCVHNPPRSPYPDALPDARLFLRRRRLLLSCLFTDARGAGAMSNQASIATHGRVSQSLPSFAQTFNSVPLDNMSSSSLPPIQIRPPSSDSSRVTPPPSRQSRSPPDDSYASSHVGKKRPHVDDSPATATADRDDRPRSRYVMRLVASHTDRLPPTSFYLPILLSSGLDTILLPLDLSE